MRSITRRFETGTSRTPPGARSNKRPRPAAWVVLALGLVLTATATYYTHTSSRNDEVQTFEQRNENISQRIASELKRYTFVLTSVQSFMASSDSVTADEFTTFVDSLNLSEGFPAAYGLAFAANVPAEDVDSFIAGQRTDRANFGVTPIPTPGESIRPLVYIVPDGPGVPIGLNASVEPFFASILAQADEPNQITMSENIETGRFPTEQQIFVLTTPIEQGGVPGLDSRQEDGQNLGWIAMPFLGDDFLAGILGSDDRGIVVQVYNGKEESNNLIGSWPVDSETAARNDGELKDESTLPLPYGRDWIVSTETLPGFATGLGNKAATNYVLIAGIVLSLLLFVLIWVVGYTLQRRRVEARLAHDATHDSLTGLPNRELFMDRVAQALARMRRQPGASVVMFIDLDGFKVVNDSLGHDTGDFLLVTIAQRISRAVREYDTVARFAGDEFVVLLEGIIDAQIAEESAARIISAIRAPLAVEDGEISVSASIGVCFANSADDEPDELLGYADAAMYQAKAKGKGSYEVFNDDLRRRTANKYEIEETLRDALEHDEFRCFLQAFYSTDARSIVGYEALVRWEHPTLGLLEPSDFLRAAADTGVIVAIDRWMLEQGCKYAVEWNAEAPDGKPATIWVNASIRQLLQADFVDHVLETVHRYNVPYHALGIEIDDDVLALDADAAARVVAPLKAAGVMCALDDFGVGYSSLARVHHLGIDVLKLDRSLIVDVDESDDALTMVRAVVSMAGTLGMTVVAEGVERQEQLDVLRAEHVDHIQGFLLARPVPGEEAPRMRSRASITSEQAS